MKYAHVFRVNFFRVAATLTLGLSYGFPSACEEIVKDMDESDQRIATTKYHGAM